MALIRTSGLICPHEVLISPGGPDSSRGPRSVPRDPDPSHRALIRPVGPWFVPWRLALSQTLIRPTGPQNRSRETHQVNQVQLGAVVWVRLDFGESKRYVGLLWAAICLWEGAWPECPHPRDRHWLEVLFCTNGIDYLGFDAPQPRISTFLRYSIFTES